MHNDVVIDNIALYNTLAFLPCLHRIWNMVTSGATHQPHDQRHSKNDRTWLGTRF